MRRTFALIVAVAVGLMAAPAVGGNPNAVVWVETDVMNDPTNPAPPRSAGDWIHEQFERKGTFEATAGGFTYTGTVGWEAAGKVKLDFSGEKPRPVFGTFRGKGTYEFDKGDGPMAGTTCRLTLQTKLVEDFTGPPGAPPFVFYGNQVAHCDNGSKIHGRILGPTGPPPEGQDFGFEQMVTGTLMK